MGDPKLSFRGIEFSNDESKPLQDDLHLACTDVNLGCRCVVSSNLTGRTGQNPLSFNRLAGVSVAEIPFFDIPCVSFESIRSVDLTRTGCPLVQVRFGAIARIIHAGRQVVELWIANIALES